MAYTRPNFTYKHAYIVVSMCLILLIPTILVFSGDAGTRSLLIGEVLDIQYYDGLLQHTTISYAAKPLKNGFRTYPGTEKNSIGLNGDLRTVFKVGAYYNITLEKRIMTVYPDLKHVDERNPVTKLIVVQGIGSEIGAKMRTTINTGYQDIVFSGDYRGLFESRGYYNITYFGDMLLGYQKLANPYLFWVSTCDLTNYDSTLVLMRMIPGNDTVVGVEVDHVPCSEFTPVSVREGETIGFTFKVSQPVVMGRIYTVYLSLSSGDIRWFNVEGKTHGSINLYA